MRKYAIVTLVFIVLVALSISGCTSSGSSDNATPTAQSATGSTATPAAHGATGDSATPSGQNTAGTTATPIQQSTSTSTATPTATESAASGQLSKVSQLVNADNLHSYTYRVSESTNGANQTFEIGIAYSDATYNGANAKLTIITHYAPASDGTYAAETPTYVYTSKTDGSVLGGANHVVTNGQATDQGISMTDASNALLDDIVNNAMVNGDIPVAYVGPETITVDGKTYDCTKYAMPMGNVSSEIEWYTPQAPMPVKSLWAPIANYTQITELVNWS